MMPLQSASLRAFYSVPNLRGCIYLSLKGSEAQKQKSATWKALGFTKIPVHDGPYNLESTTKSGKVIHCRK